MLQVQFRSMQEVKGQKFPKYYAYLRPFYFSMKDSLRLVHLKVFEYVLFYWENEFEIYKGMHFTNWIEKYEFLESLYD